MNQNNDIALSDESKEMIIRSLEKTLERREQNIADPESPLTEEYYEVVEETLKEAKTGRTDIK